MFVFLTAAAPLFLPVSPTARETKLKRSNTTKYSSQKQIFRIGADENNKAQDVSTDPVGLKKAQERSLALLTIQSVGIISVAITVGTVVLYWLAGDFFVHLGPREYPGALSSRSSLLNSSPTIERTVGEEAGANEEAVVGGGGEDTARRLVERRGTRDAFHFEGFPEVGSVRPDF